MSGGNKLQGDGPPDEQGQRSLQKKLESDEKREEDLFRGLEELNLDEAPAVDNSEDHPWLNEWDDWDSQPEPNPSVTIDESLNTFVESNLPVDQIRAEPYTLPDAFVWSDIDIEVSCDLCDLYMLLSKYQMEDGDTSILRLAYLPDFLSWALKFPGWLPEWRCGLRARESGTLIGFISAVPKTLRIYGKVIKTVQINFLCVHKRLKGKKVEQVLVKEITRRVNRRGIFQAMYSTESVLSDPMANCRYWHRPLDIKKLIECGFSCLPPKMNLWRAMKHYKLNIKAVTPGIRLMEEKDAVSAFRLLSKDLNQYCIVPIYNLEEFKYKFMPRDEFLYSYVIEKNGNVTDFVSFYSLPSSVRFNRSHKTISAAYLNLYVATSIPPKQLINDVVILAQQNGFDVFNALDIMHNSSFLEDLRVGSV